MCQYQRCSLHASMPPPLGEQLMMRCSLDTMGSQLMFGAAIAVAAAKSKSNAKSKHRARGKGKDSDKGRGKGSEEGHIESRGRTPPPVPTNRDDRMTKVLLLRELLADFAREGERSCA